jgi:hypothetical protein
VKRPFDRAIQLLQDEIRFLEDFPHKAEGGAESVPYRIQELREAIEILEKEKTND